MSRARLPAVDLRTDLPGAIRAAARARLPTKVPDAKGPKRPLETRRGVGAGRRFSFPISRVAGQSEITPNMPRGANHREMELLAREYN
jgi:hypothetical protein